MWHIQGLNWGCWFCGVPRVIYHVIALFLCLKQQELNAIFSKPLKKLLSSETEVDDAALISIDSKGTDIRVRQGAQVCIFDNSQIWLSNTNICSCCLYDLMSCMQFNIQRISFDEGQSVETLEEAKAALRKLIHKGKVYNLQK